MSPRSGALLSLICCVAFHFASAQRQPRPAPPRTEKLTRILFVFDASRSMSAKHEGSTRMDGAKALFNKFLDTLGRHRNYQFALRLYGSTVKYPPGDCRDSRLAVPFGANNLAAIREKVKASKPTGITPIEHSLTEAANDFPDARSTNIVIVITDGIEECGGDPCRAREKLLEKGIVFRPFIIGIGLSPEQVKTFACVGNFFDYDNDSTFAQITGIIQSQMPLRTTLQVNLLDDASRPTETNVNMTLYDATTGKYRYNLVHALNYAGRPDTLIVDAQPVYKVVAHTIPPVESGTIALAQGRHNVIALDAPQGFLAVKRNEGAYNFNEKVKCVVRRQGGADIVNVQPLNTTEKYITGAYDIEVLTLPRIYFNAGAVVQGKTTTLEIPSAGMVQMRCTEPGDGCILLRKEKLEWVCNLTGQTIQNFYLQPGQYVVTWRAKSLRGSIYTIEKSFSVASDSQTLVELYR